MKRGIDTQVRRYYAEHEDTLHVFDDSSARNEYLLENPTAYVKQSNSSKARRYRQKRLDVAVWHRSDGAVYVERNGNITDVLENGDN